eukprot:COSAG01_NODE_3183_length_6447_cov_3.930687_2_plen_140_part_00
MRHVRRLVRRRFPPTTTIRRPTARRGRRRGTRLRPRLRLGHRLWGRGLRLRDRLREVLGCDAEVEVGLEQPVTHSAELAAGAQTPYLAALAQHLRRAPRPVAPALLLVPLPLQRLPSLLLLSCGRLWRQSSVAITAVES